MNPERRNRPPSTESKEFVEKTRSREADQDPEPLRQTLEKEGLGMNTIVLRSGMVGGANSPAYERVRKPHPDASPFLKSNRFKG